MIINSLCFCVVSVQKVSSWGLPQLMKVIPNVARMFIVMFQFLCTKYVISCIVCVFITAHDNNVCYIVMFVIVVFVIACNHELY